MGSVEAVLAERLLSLSLEQKVRLLTGADLWSLHPEPDVGLRRLVLSDGPAGVRSERLDAQVMPEANGDVMVKVRVRTTWPRPGREIVQVHAARGEGLVERPTRWLAGFTGVDAGPGEETTSEVAIPARTFAHSDSGSRAWTVEPGTFQLQVGWSSQDPPICADVAFPATAGTSPLGPG
jgi:Fibronectin type III-like domain